MRKLGIDINDAKPTGAQIHKALKYFNLAVKLEVALHELNHNLILLSFMELVFYVIGSGFYMSSGDNAVMMICFLPHAIRGCIGVHLGSSLPSSHDIIESMHLEKTDYDLEADRPVGGEHVLMSFEEIKRRISSTLQQIFFEEHYQSRRSLKAYLGLTILSTILDFFAIIVFLNEFGTKGKEYEDMTGLFFCLLFYGVNFVWAGQAMLLKYKFPYYIGKYLYDALMRHSPDFQERAWTIQAKAKVQFEKLKALGRRGAGTGSENN